MTRFYILRHGETAWNHDHNRYCGRTDILLSQTGQNQAHAAAAFLKDITFDAVYASPLVRAEETAKIVSRVSRSNIILDRRLLEIDFGKWEGKTKSEIQQLLPDNWYDWNTDPTCVRAGETGETATEVYERAQSFFQEACRKHPDETVLVVAHNTLNRLFITGSMGLPFYTYRKFPQSNTGISLLDMTPSELQWVQLNGMIHLLVKETV